MAGRHVAIVGAGIAGLTLAIALDRRGIASTILEQAPEFRDIGAGLQLSPNATRILDRLGLTPRLAARWHEPPAVDLVSGLSLRKLARLPLGDNARRRWGSPYAVMHRADLHDVLLQEVRKCGGIELLTGVRIGTGKPLEEVARATGRALGPDDLVVGADGVWSQLRRVADPASRAVFSGMSAWRMQVHPAAFAGLADAAAVTAFLAPSAHLVAYPLPAHDAVNLVAIAPGGDAAGGWEGSDDAETMRREILAITRRWHPAFRGIVDGAEITGRWPIFAMDRSVWHGNGVVLIGDAAHAMTPYAAQGAAMAIEDAFALAASIARSPDDTLAASRRFAAGREPRVARVRQRAAFNRFAYHASGPLRLGRNLVLAARSGASLAADFDWLYGEDPPNP